MTVVSLGKAITQPDVQRAVDRLDEFLQQVLHQTGVPSLSMAVVYNGSMIYANAAGVREIGSNESVSPETVYQLASLSKPIGATAVAGLVSDGYLNWNSSANDLDPLIQLSDPWITRDVTVEDFYAHRSGLFGGAGNDLEVFGLNRTQILSRLQYLNPTGAYRASYQYSNYGITSGAQAAAAAAGLTWEDAIKSRLYDRCNMTSTSSVNADFMAESNRASLHIRPDNSTNSSAPFIVAPLRNPDPQAPAGGVSSNVIDLAKWMQLQLGAGSFGGEQIIDSTPLLYTHEPRIIRGIEPSSGQLGWYGLGWNVDYDAPASGRIYISHAGAFSSGTRSFARLNMADGLGVVALSNCWPTGSPEALAYTFFDWVYYGNETQDWVTLWENLYNTANQQLSAIDPGFEETPANPGGPLSGPDVYIGNYSNSYVGSVTVSAGNETSNESLEIQIGEKSFPLRHWDRDLFILYPIVETPDAPTAVTFVIGSSGVAELVIIDVLNGDNGGVLKRVA